MKPSHLLSQLKNALINPLPVGGLEISATSLKYLLVKNQTITQASLRLPVGIIAHGEIKDSKSLTNALKSLHLQISPLNKSITIILNLPSSIPFTQAFSVPLVDMEHLEESIQLNLQMISPNKIEESYYDWQEVKINKDLGHIDLLGAFAPRKRVDEFTTCLKNANFNVIAVEFPGLALSRLIKQRWGGLEAEESYLLMYINGDGLLLMILKNGNAYFNHFTPWEQAIGGAKELTGFDQIKGFFVQEIQRVLNFYLGRFGKSLTDTILISPIFNYEIVKTISQTMGLKIRNLTIAELPKLQPNWFPVLGSGLRGLTPRGADIDITLTTENAQTEYYEERTLMFLSAWRNIIVGVMVFMLAAFIGVNTLFTREDVRLRTKITTEFSTKDLADSQKVQEQVADFNQQLTFIEKMTEQEASWSPFMRAISEVAGKGIVIEHLIANKANSRNTITGQASSEEAAISFKNRLAADSRFKNVKLPLSDLTIEPDKSVTFNLSFESSI